MNYVIGKRSSKLKPKFQWLGIYLDFLCNIIQASLQFESIDSASFIKEKSIHNLSIKERFTLLYADIQN